MIAVESLRSVIFEQNPPSTYSLRDFAFDQPTFQRVTALQGFYGTTDPDIAPFAAAGHKLLLWHGWSDPHISPINTIAYYEAVQRRLGPHADATARLYLFPGMDHCGEGQGSDAIDLLTPMMAWVERGVAPERIVARRTASAADAPSVGGAALGGRPVFPYPQVAVYGGRGDINAATNWTARDGQRGPDQYDWAGANLFAPGRRLDCRVARGALQCAPAH